MTTPSPTESKPSGAPRKRRIKLIVPSLQFRLIGAFAGIATLALLAEYVVMAARLSSFANTMPAGGSHLVSELPGLVLEMLAVSFGILLPAIIGIGILVTFRVAGPVHRFQEHLRAVARGEDPGPCRIRKTDYLHELCGLINEALERVQSEDNSDSEDEGRKRAA